MKASPAAARTIAEAAGQAAFGLLAAVAVGALATAGLDLLAPQVLPVASASDALGQSVRFGLASIGAPVEAGGVTGTAAPLTGAVAAAWAIASSVRARAERSPAALTIGSVAASMAGLCALAAAVTRDAGAGASPGRAALSGLVWGAAAAAAGRALAARRGSAPSAAARSLRTLLLGAGGLAAAWLLVAGLVSFAAGAVGVAGLGGSFLVAAAFAPNVLGALVALGCGGRVELTYGYEGGTTALEGAALWDWHGGLAPWYVLVLVLVPLVATVAAAAATRGEPPLRRGLRNGAALGAALLVLGRAGSFEAKVGDGAAEAGVRLGIDPVPAAVLGLAWGVAGSLLARWLPRAAGGPTLGRP